MGAADRPPRRDPQPGRPGEALGRLRSPSGTGLRGALRRVATASPKITREPPSSSWSWPASSPSSEGRYLVREGQTQRVLIITPLGAPRPQRKIRRRGKAVEPGDPEAVPVTRVTVTGERLSDAAEGDAWIEATLRAPEAPAEIRSATSVINRALSALRAGARDPLVQEVGASKALAVRIGHGTGQELADGRWTAARELPRKSSGGPTRRAPVARRRGSRRPRRRASGRNPDPQVEVDLDQGRESEARYGPGPRGRRSRIAPSDDKQLLKQFELVEKKLGSYESAARSARVDHDVPDHANSSVGIERAGPWVITAIRPCLRPRVTEGRPATG